MHFIDSHWDTRNLGLTTQELVVGKHDTLEELRDAVGRLNSEYKVIRLENVNLEMFRFLAEEEFVFAEQLSSWTLDLTLHRESEGSKKLPQLTSKSATSEEIVRIFEEIRSGMFSTDRISLDNRFGAKIGGERYVNWLRDEIRLGGNLRTISFRGTPVGFFSFRESSPNVPSIALSGIFGSFKLPGLGLALQREIINASLAIDARSITTVVSTANSPAIRAHISSGFQWKSVQTVFTSLKSS